MKFTPSFPLNHIVSNSELAAEFKCGNMGGMRRSRQTNTLVIITDNTKGLYDDKWYGDVLHYTGMGMNGDQSIDFMQNKTLSESRHNEIAVHLFEVLISSQYIYKGEVELCQEPYQNSQKGEDGVLRKVWIFPVRMKSGDLPIDESLIIEYEKKRKREAKRLSLSELKQRAENIRNEGAQVRYVKSYVYIRDPYVSEYAKRRAAGICQLCGTLAPFTDIDGSPFLETHHIEWLSRGGADTIENTVALCPNCHRRMHILDRIEDKRKLSSLI